MAKFIEDNFDSPTLHPYWQVRGTGGGNVEWNGKEWELVLPAHDKKIYHSNQIDDYAGLKRTDYPWSPPLRMTVRAWTSHSITQLKGTAGFGFWNHPYSPSGGLPRIPKAMWFFFASPPNNMALAKGQPGHGWKVATFDAQTPLFFAMLPGAPLGFLLMRFPWLYRRIWPLGQYALGISEKQIPTDFNTPHEYELIWRAKSVEFFIDGQLFHHSPHSPKPPLGFAAWLDNQYAIVTPQGRFGFGFIEREEKQSLIMDYVRIETLDE